MRISELVRVHALGCLLAAAALLASAGGSLAIDQDIFDDKGDVKPQSSPWDVFQFGYSAYKSGHKDQAAEAYRYAAENGQIGATWKLARMYAAGDGVTRDDYEAFKFFSEIVEQDVEPGSREESYVSDALVAFDGTAIVDDDEAFVAAAVIGPRPLLRIAGEVAHDDGIGVILESGIGAPELLA